MTVNFKDTFLENFDKKFKMQKFNYFICFKMMAMNCKTLRIFESLYLFFKNNFSNEFILNILISDLK